MGNYSPSKIRRMGIRAFENGESLEDNPFGASPPAYLVSSFDSWEEGWQEAERKEEEEKLQLEARSVYEIPLSEFETLGDLMDALEKYKE